MKSSMYLGFWFMIGCSEPKQEDEASDTDDSGVSDTDDTDGDGLSFSDPEYFEEGIHDGFYNIDYFYGYDDELALMREACSYIEVLGTGRRVNLIFCGVETTCRIKEGSHPDLGWYVDCDSTKISLPYTSEEESTVSFYNVFLWKEGFFFEGEVWMGSSNDSGRFEYGLLD